jgi:hypothetical protein
MRVPLNAHRKELAAAEGAGRERRNLSRKFRMRIYTVKARIAERFGLSFFGHSSRSYLDPI